MNEEELSLSNNPAILEVEMLQKQLSQALQTIEEFKHANQGTRRNDNRKFWVRTIIALGVFGAILYGFFKEWVAVVFFEGMLAGGIADWYFKEEN